MHNRVHFIKPVDRAQQIYHGFVSHIGSDPQRSSRFHESMQDFRTSYRSGAPHRGDVVVVQDRGQLADFKPMPGVEYLVLRENGIVTPTLDIPPDNVTLYDVPENPELTISSIDILSRRALTKRLTSERTRRKNVVGIEGVTGDVGRQAAIKLLEHNAHTSTDTKVILLEYGPNFEDVYESIATDNPVIEEQVVRQNLKTGTLRDIVNEAFLTLTFQANSTLKFSNNRDDHLKGNVGIYEARHSEIVKLAQGQIPIQIIGSNYPEGIARRLYELEKEMFFRGQHYSVAGHDHSRAVKGVAQLVGREDFDRSGLIDQRVELLLARMQLRIAGTHNTVIPLPYTSTVSNGDVHTLQEAFDFSDEDLAAISSAVRRSGEANKTPGFCPTDYITAIVQAVDAFQRGGPAWLSGPLSWKYNSGLIDFSPRTGAAMGYGISLFDTTNIGEPESLYSARKARDKFTLAPDELVAVVDVLEQEKDHLDMLSF